ncbi:hypothetical protein B0H10DRAFT_1954806 [Mycena sp. CBHHK59/15]|nr:hypothetical protein B0H10DRAFT_1954806 [Mycena sp. CBHHK59/15]
MASLIVLCLSWQRHGLVRLKGMNAIKAAIRANQTDKLKALLDNAPEGAAAVVDCQPLPNGLNPWDISNLEEKGWDVRNLHFAFVQENEEAAQILLKAGANPDIKDASGRTAAATDSIEAIDSSYLQAAFRSQMGSSPGKQGKFQKLLQAEADRQLGYYLQSAKDYALVQDLTGNMFRLKEFLSLIFTSTKFHPFQVNNNRLVVTFICIFSIRCTV